MTLNLSSWTWLPALLSWLNLSQMHWPLLVQLMPPAEAWAASGSPWRVIPYCGGNHSLTTLSNVLYLRRTPMDALMNSDFELTSIVGHQDILAQQQP